jgi:hypothetical protein
MPSAVAVATQNTFRAVQGTYKNLFTKEYLGNASKNAKAHNTSKARYVFGRVLVAVGLTAGAPIVLPVAIARGIYKGTKEENARRNPTFPQTAVQVPIQPPQPPPPSAQAPQPPPPVTNLAVNTASATTNQEPSSLEVNARKLLVSRGVSEQGATEMAAYVYRVSGKSPDDPASVPDFNENDLLALSKILEADPSFKLVDLDAITADSL